MEPSVDPSSAHCPRRVEVMRRDEARAAAVASRPRAPRRRRHPPPPPGRAKRRRWRTGATPSAAPLVDGPWRGESLASGKISPSPRCDRLSRRLGRASPLARSSRAAINCAIVSCPIASHRAEMRALRDNGVYGSSMAPYLDELRRVYDATEARKAEAEEAPAEFSESDESDEESEAVAQQTTSPRRIPSRSRTRGGPARGGGGGDARRLGGGW